MVRGIEAQVAADAEMLLAASRRYDDREY